MSGSVRVDGPSRRFFEGGEPAGEESSSSGGFGSTAGAADESKEKEFWVAIPEEAAGIEDDTFLCFLGILNTK